MTENAGGRAGPKDSRTDGIGEGARRTEADSKGGGASVLRHGVRGEMEAPAAELRAAVEALGECVSRALREIAVLDTVQLETIEDVLAQVDEGLASSDQRQQSKVAVSVRLGAELTAFSCEITRQQVEHVVAGLQASLGFTRSASKIDEDPEGISSRVGGNDSRRPILIGNGQGRHRGWCRRQAGAL